MTLWRLICDDGASAAGGLALDEALMNPYARAGARGAEAQATLRLYTYRSHCALVGRYQSLGDEIDLAACRQLGVEVGRRPTGGGAIVMGAGQLGIAVTTAAPAEVAPRDVLRLYADGVIAGLQRLGVTAGFRSKNDLEVSGRKVAGLGLYVDDQGALLFHASVLADLDIAFMLSVLNIPGAKLSDRGLARVADRVTTVSEQMGRRVGGADLREAMRAGFAEALGVTLVAAEPTASERAGAGALERDKYSATEWLEQRSPRRDGQGTAVFKTPEGLARVYVGVHGGALKSVMVAGDFNVMPAALTRMEAELRWCPARPDAIGARVERALGGSRSILGTAPETVVVAVWEAAERALERERGAHPVRPAGACYAPDGAGEPSRDGDPREAVA